MLQPNLFTLDSLGKYRSKNLDTHLIVDTNVLLIFLVGSYDPSYIKDCPLMTRNGKNYNEKHFRLIQKLFEIFLNKIAITPQILSEIHSLAKNNIEPVRFREYFKKIIIQLEKCVQHTVSLESLLNNEYLLDFGFTDISIVEASAEKKWMILTDEAEMCRKFGESIPLIPFSSLVVSELYKL